MHRFLGTVAVIFVAVLRCEQNNSDTSRSIVSNAIFNGSLSCCVSQDVLLVSAKVTRGKTTSTGVVLFRQTCDSDSALKLGYNRLELKEVWNSQLTFTQTIPSVSCAFFSLTFSSDFATFFSPTFCSNPNASMGNLQTTMDICGNTSFLCLLEKTKFGDIFPPCDELVLKRDNSLVVSKEATRSHGRTENANTFCAVVLTSLLSCTVRFRKLVYCLLVLQLIMGTYCSYRELFTNTSGSRTNTVAAPCDTSKISKRDSVKNASKLTADRSTFAGMERMKTSEFSRADSAQQKISSNASYSDSWTMTFVKGEHKSRLKRNGNSNFQTPVAKSCTLHLVADYLFFTQVGGSDVMTTANVMKDAVRDADAIFRSTDFDQDGVGDNIGFLVINITVLRNYPSPYFSYSLDSSDPQQYLRTFSRLDHSKVCLAVVFTHLNFERSVGGVAWAASSSPAASPGGLCQPPVYVDKEAAHFSFNTVAVTFRTGGKTVSRNTALRFLLHELGHSFGSAHDGDSDSCRLTSGSKLDGAFMMSHQSSTGEMPNNYRFSPCSVRAMFPVIVHKGTCLHEHRNSHCGNGLKEDGEECDCGNSAMCPYRDTCCTPSDVSQNSSDPPCTFHRSKGKTCSPLSSPCCTANCTVVRDVTRVCDVGTDCMGLSLCDGVSDECPEAPIKQNGTVCGGGSRFCEGGHCTGSVCHSYALIACQCIIPVIDRCKVCCKTSNDSDCLALETFGVTESRGENRPRYLTAGESCWSPDPAFCDDAHVCASISSTDNTQNGFFQSTSRWISRHWLYVLEASLCIVVGMTAFTTSRFRRKNSHIKAVHYGKVVAIFRIATLLKLHIMHDIALGRYLLDRYQRKVARGRVPLHYWEAVSRVRTFFPSCPLSHIANTVTLATSEDVVVCMLLAQGFPMRRFMSKLTSSEVARCGKLSRMYKRQYSLLNLDYNFTPEHSSGSSSFSSSSGSPNSDESSDITLFTRAVNALHSKSVSRASSTSQIGLPSLAGKYISFHREFPPGAGPSVNSVDTQSLFLRDTAPHLMTYPLSNTIEGSIYDPEYHAYLRRLKEEMQKSRKTLNSASKDCASRPFVYTRAEDKRMDTLKKGTPTEKQPWSFSMFKSVTRKKTRNSAETLSKISISSKKTDELCIADKKKKSREAACASAKAHDVRKEGSPLAIAEEGTLPEKTDGAVKTEKPGHDETYVGEVIKHSGTANLGKVVTAYWFGWNKSKTSTCTERTKAQSAPGPTVASDEQLASSP